MAARVKNHHYLSQGYLRNFSIDGNGKQIYQIPKTGAYRETPISIENAGCERDFHTIDKGGGVRDSQSLEGQLAKLEHLYLGVVRRAIQDQMVDKDHERLCEFVALSDARVPGMKEHLEEVIAAFAKAHNSMLAEGDRLERSIEKHNSSELIKYPPQIRKVFCDRIRTMIKENRFTIKVSNARLLHHMFQQAFNPQFIGVLTSRGWSVLEAAKGHSFVTCDQPVAVFDRSAIPKNPVGRPLYAKGVEITFALGSRTLLRLDDSNHRGTRIQLDVEETAEMNRRAIIMARRFIFASAIDEKLRSFVQANRDHNAGLWFNMITIDPGNTYAPAMGRVAVCPRERYP